MPAQGVPGPPASAPAATGKGRPTPKRREAEKRRRTPVIAPATRKEASKAARSRARDDRLRARRALSSGDERNLPARDAGPVRRFVRDYVDRRRNAGGLFLPSALIVFLLGLTRLPALVVTSYLVFLLMWIAIAIDCVVLVRGLRRGVTARFPAAGSRGLGFYAVMRALQVRRLRLPPPKVKRGQQLPAP